jgi:hypothetical protein
MLGARTEAVVAPARQKRSGDGLVRTMTPAEAHRRLPTEGKLV